MQAKSIIKYVIALVMVGGVMQASDSFPPSWAISNTWTVAVKQYTPSSRAAANPPDHIQMYTKTFFVESETVETNRVVVALRITNNYNRGTYRVRFDKQTKTFISSVSLDVAKNKEGSLRTNRYSTGDSYSDPFFGQGLFLFDIPKFPVPNQEESRTIYDNGRYKLTQSVTFNADKTEAVVVFRHHEKGNSLIWRTVQFWKVGQPWPTVSTQYIDSDSPSYSNKVQIVETLIPSS